MPLLEVGTESLLFFGLRRFQLGADVIPRRAEGRGNSRVKGGVGVGSISSGEKRRRYVTKHAEGVVSFPLLRQKGSHLGPV